MVHITAGLSYDTNEPVLKNEFGKYGEVLHGEAPKTQDTAFTLSNCNSVQLKKRLARLPLPIPRLETISITPRLTPVSLPGSSFLPH
ncbi:hypothetical protein DY000_02001060 [Brassica cretica]|uniref:RRM domain-containing protein n=1 Tax=Brassica cretica TaxID=69181 RepID=A0ABQ7C9J0_BRACR|nr:hypothetical protein DY000_02001060 [Brassica cretica]